jgi:hypothetical protein
LDRRLGGRQSRSGHGGEEKNSQPPPGIEVWKVKKEPRPRKLRVVTKIFYSCTINVSNVIVIIEGKAKVSAVLLLTAPRHEGVLGEWMYTSTHS